MLVAVSRSQRRIVAWSLAAERAGGQWSLFHFRPAVQNLEGSP